MITEQVVALEARKFDMIPKIVRRKEKQKTFLAKYLGKHFNYFGTVGGFEKLSACSALL